MQENSYSRRQRERRRGGGGMFGRWCESLLVIESRKTRSAQSDFNFRNGRQRQKTTPGDRQTDVDGDEDEDGERQTDGETNKLSQQCSRQVEEEGRVDEARVGWRLTAAAVAA